jgi:hypothetical protein
VVDNRVLPRRVGFVVTALVVVPLENLHVVLGIGLVPPNLFLVINRIREVAEVHFR